MIKGILFVFAGLFILVTLISLLMPGRVVVTRATPVHGDSLKIFNELSNLQNWKHWHPVFKNDQAKITFANSTTPPTLYNQSAQWITNGKKNTLLITGKKYPVVEVTLLRDGESPAYNYLSVLPIQEQGNMQVEWTAITKLRWYPWEKFGGIFIEQMTAAGYEAALKNLKELIESER